MIDFKLYATEDAPEPSRAMLNGAEEKFGFVPNVLRQMAESPAALGGTMQLMGLLGESSLTPAEQWIALLVVARENASGYCVAANSTVARMMEAPAEVIEGVRRGERLDDPRFEALRVFTEEMVRERGRVSEQTMRRFIDAGFTKAQVFEVVLVVALETMASYTDRAAATPLDEQYQANVWSRREPAAVGAD